MQKIRKNLTFVEMYGRMRGTGGAKCTDIKSNYLKAYRRWFGLARVRSIDTIGKTTTMKI